MDPYSCNLTRKRQEKFYRHFKKKLENGVFLEVGGQASYVKKYAKEELLPPFFAKEVEFENVVNELNQLKDWYGDVEFSSNMNVRGEIEHLQGGVCVWADRYVEAWEFRHSMRLRLREYLAIKEKAGKNLASVDFVNFISGYSTSQNIGCLTNFGNEYLEPVLVTLDTYLNEFREQHSSDYIEHFIDQQYRDKRKARPFFVGDSLAETELCVRIIPGEVWRALLAQARDRLKECENIVREKRGVPRIGEGWVGETELFYKVSDAFPNETVKHHGSPKWLGNQHLDIYFPDHKLAIEYQGKQHFEPVEFFGGEESFREQKERDERKRRLCAENNCILIAVRKNYDWKNLKSSVEKAIA